MAKKSEFVKKDDKTLVKNIKTDNVYYVKDVKLEKHKPLTKKEAEKYEKDVAEKEKNIISKAKDVVSKPISKDTRNKLKNVFIKHIEHNNMKPVYRRIFGKTYVVAIDDKQNRIVYDWDGNQYNISDFFGVAKNRAKIEDKLNNIHNLNVYLGTLDKKSESDIEKLKKNKEVKYDFLTDNRQIKNKLTRSYPTVEDEEGRKVIIDGRFKGHYLDDMINRIGRQVAGSAYVMEGSIPKPIEYKDGKITKFRVEHEPYVTKLSYADKYKLIIPSWDKNNIKRIKKLSEMYKTIQISKDGTSVTFQYSDFEEINETLGGFTMSEQAALDFNKKIEQRKKFISDDKEYEKVSTSNIKGMKSERDFMVHQKKAIHTVIKKTGNTVIGLDTGTGKTMVGAGIMMQWINDGTLRKNNKNGKALFIVPKSLKGNFPGEIKRLVDDYDKIKEKFDVVSYGDFTKNSEKYKEYGAIFFDEAQALRKTSSKVSKTALLFNHPRKIPMTASVLEKSPMDLYNLISIANNQGSNIDEHRAKMTRFVNTYCEKVGNKVIGLKDDPAIRDKFRRWVKENTVYAEKTDVQEIPLPSVTPSDEKTESLMMDEKLKEKYDELIHPIRDTIDRMVVKYRDKTLSTNDINQELSRVMGKLQTIKNFLNNPDDYIEGIKNPKIERTYQIIHDNLMKDDTSKTVTFTDSPSLSQKTGKILSERIKYKKHVVALADEIQVWKNGEIIDKFTESTKIKDSDGKRVSKDEWQTHLIREFQFDRDVSTFNLTSAYAKGHNIQSATNMIHLDRDSWNNENMKQRDARIWRTGQKKPVTIKIVDLVNDDGTSLDTIQKYSMEIEQKLFDELIKKSKDIKLDDKYDVVDIENLIKNKEALMYILNPSVDYSYNIKN